MNFLNVRNGRQGLAYSLVITALNDPDPNESHQIPIESLRVQTYFISIDDMKETDTNFCVNLELAKMKGLLFEEFVR